MSKLPAAIVIATVCVLLASCATPTVKLSATDASRLRGKGLAISVVPAGALASNPESAMLFGAVGQAVKGRGLQEKYSLEDPALGVKERLATALGQSFGTTSADMPL